MKLVWTWYGLSMERDQLSIWKRQYGRSINLVWFEYGLSINLLIMEVVSEYGGSMEVVWKEYGSSMDGVSTLV